MLFVSKFSNRTRFSHFRTDNSSSVALYNRSMEKLKQRLVSYKNLLYNFESGGLLDAKTKKNFTGKFFIPSERTFRVIKVINGQEVSNGVFFRTGERYSLEIIGHEPKKFHISPWIVGKADIAKLQSTADQSAYDFMVNNFAKEVEAGRIDLYS